MERADEINAHRLASWNRYYEELKPLADVGKLDLPVVPDGCIHNAQMFYVKLKDAKERAEFIDYMKQHGVMTAFHYVPLHSSPAGLRFGRFNGEDKFTTRESERLVRLPLYYELSKEDQSRVVSVIKEFFSR